MRSNSRSVLLALAGLSLSVVMAGCKPNDAEEGTPNASGTSRGRGSSEVIVDGSSTVAPITTAVAEEFSRKNRNVRVGVGTSGTGGGFKKFINGEIDICDASRIISESEKEALKERGIEYIELKVGMDGITVVVNPENDWMENVSVDQLNKIWSEGSKITKWSEIDSSYPDEPLKLFGPDTDSGTFDYFTEEICGGTGASRSDYQQSADDNFLVTGVAGEKNAMGYFGFAYFVENKAKLKAVPVSNGGEPVMPNEQTIESGEYAPLSRPMFLYVTKSALKRPEVVDFLRFYFSEEGSGLVAETGYIKLSPEMQAEQVKTLEDAIAEVQGSAAPSQAAE